MSSPAYAKRAQLRYRQTEKGKARRRAANERYQSSGQERIKQKERVYAHRQWLHGIKSVPCADCGNTFDPVCMDFDHRPGEQKLFTISQSTYFDREKLLAEIAKCDIVCANCHRIRTFVRRSHPETCAEAKRRAPTPQLSFLDQEDQK